MRSASLLCALAILSACGGEPPQTTTNVLRRLQPEVNGVAFEGRYVTVENPQGVVDRSGVIVMRRDDQPSVGVARDGEQTVFRINDKTVALNGRPLVLTRADGAFTVIADDLLNDAFRTEDLLEAEVARLLASAKLPPQW